MQSIQIESGSMYNTTSKRLNYKQLDPIDAQAPKKDGAEEASPLNSTRVEASACTCRFQKPELLEQSESTATVEWEKGSRGRRRRRPTTAIAACWWPCAADPPLAACVRPTMGLKQGRVAWVEGSRSSGEQANGLDRRAVVWWCRVQGAAAEWDRI